MAEALTSTVPMPMRADFVSSSSNESRSYTVSAMATRPCSGRFARPL